MRYLRIFCTLYTKLLKTQYIFPGFHFIKSFAATDSSMQNQSSKPEIAEYLT